jgi:ABC-2 type transport system permease protein
MDKLLQVAVYEYGRNVYKKSFIFTLLSIPCSIALMVCVGLFIESRQDNRRPVGIVDYAGVLDPALITPQIHSYWQVEYGRPVEFLVFPTGEEAHSALEAHDIQAFFILPEHYLSTRKMGVVYIKEPGDKTWRQFYDFLRISLLAGQQHQKSFRAAVGLDFIVRSIDGRREVPAASGPTFGLFMPLFIALAFLFMLLMSSGYSMGAIAEEKENRTLEVLVTTISPVQLIGGKILGVVAISLTLLSAWTVVVTLGIFISRQAGVGWFNDLSMDWRSVTAIAAIAIPAYALATALMTAISVMMTTSQESQSISGIFFALHLVPMYISISFLNNPQSSLAVLLSVLPFTSLMTVGMRNLFTIVPTWQVLVSVAVQTICAAGAVWLASCAFRQGMLRFGQRVTVRHLLGRS